MNRVLIVDDDPVTLKHCHAILMSCKTHLYEVFLSSDPLEAIKNLVNIPVDLVVSDIMMPKVNGHTFLRAARDLPLFHTPIVMISGRRDEKTVNNALALGACDYIYKPLDRDLFLKKIHHWISVPKAELK